MDLDTKQKIAEAIRILEELKTEGSLESREFEMCKLLFSAILNITVEQAEEELVWYLYEIDKNEPVITYEDEEYSIDSPEAFVDFEWENKNFR